MILARLSRAIRQQNWFAVILEFVIVIAGVVIGFQVSNWASDQHDRTAERRHLTRIAEDLRTDYQQLDDIIAPTLGRIAAIHLVLETAGAPSLDAPVVFSDQSIAIPDLPPLSDIQRQNLLGSINLTRALFGHRNGFDALLESGGTDLIRDDALGQSLQEYYTGLDSFGLVQDLVRDLRQESMQRGHDAGLAIFGPATLDDLVAAAQAHPEFGAALRSNRDWAVIHQQALRLQMDATATLLGDIDAYMEENQP
jgi:hypothetical protein